MKSVFTTKQKPEKPLSSTFPATASMSMTPIAERGRGQVASGGWLGNQFPPRLHHLSPTSPRSPGELPNSLVLNHKQKPEIRTAHGFKCMLLNYQWVGCFLMFLVSMTWSHTHPTKKEQYQENQCRQIQVVSLLFGALHLVSCFTARKGEWPILRAILRLLGLTIHLHLLSFWRANFAARVGSISNPQKKLWKFGAHKTPTSI